MASIQVPDGGTYPPLYSPPSHEDFNSSTSTESDPDEYKPLLSSPPQIKGDGLASSSKSSLRDRYRGVS